MVKYYFFGGIMLKIFLKNKISWIIMLLIVLMPILTTLLVSKPSTFKNFTIENDWIGFFGSYTGSIVGGLITLYVMAITIKNGDTNLHKSISENKNLQQKNDKTIFCNDVAGLIANYCSECKKYIFYSTICQQNNKTLLLCEKSLKNCENELSNKEKNPIYMRQVNQGVETIELKNFNLAKEKYNLAKADLDLSLNKIESINLMPLYFLLKIKLKNINEAKKVMDIITNINLLIELNIDDTNFNQKLKIIYSDLDKLLDETSTFINTYTKD